VRPTQGPASSLSRRYVRVRQGRQIRADHRGATGGRRYEPEGYCAGTWHPGRASSPLRPSLSSRYTRVSRKDLWLPVMLFCT
jgi:hypothetical protein